MFTKNEFWRIVKQLIQLLSSGFFLAIILTLISKPTFMFFKNESRLFIIDYQIWQTLGITIIKVGIDQYVFVKVSNSNDYTFNFRDFIVKTQMLNIVFVLLHSLINPFLISILLGLTLFFDLLAIIYISEFNGRREFNITSFSNLIRIVPSYLIICIFSNWVDNYKIALIILIFSFLRFLFLYRKRVIKINNQNHKVEHVRIQVIIILQQLFNFLLFKIDSIYIGINRKIGLSLIENNDLNLLYSYQRFPDLVSGILTTLSPVILPYIYSNKNSNKIIKYYFVCVILLLITIIIYLYILDLGIQAELIITLFINSNLIFVINYYTFELMSENKLGFLVKILILSCSIGLALILLTIVLDLNIKYLIYAVPIQFISFIFFYKIYLKNNVQ